MPLRRTFEAVGAASKSFTYLCGLCAGSKDLQNVNITLRILFRPRPDALPNIYTTLGSDYDDRVLPSITNEVRMWGKGFGLGLTFSGYDLQ
jgi:hypothetical protein